MTHEPADADSWPLLTPRTRLDSAISALVIITVLVGLVVMLAIEAAGRLCCGIARAIASDVTGR